MRGLFPLHLAMDSCLFWFEALDFRFERGKAIASLTDSFNE